MKTLDGIILRDVDEKELWVKFERPYNGIVDEIIISMYNEERLDKRLLGCVLVKVDDLITWLQTLKGEENEN